MDIVNHKFLEYGEHRGNYYGTSLESVHKVIGEGKVCLLDVQPHEEDFEDMISSAEAMDSQYGHLFEMVIVNGDFAMAFNKLRAELEKLETEEPQWIPVEWT
ncbi:unnamed protein product, partial [Coregonus sp. 'balchen']